YLTFEGKPVVALYAFIDIGHQADSNVYQQFFAAVNRQVQSDTGIEVSLRPLNTVDPTSSPPTFDLTGMYNPLLQSATNPQAPWPAQSTVYTSQSGVRVASMIPGYNDSILRPEAHNPVVD